MRRTQAIALLCNYVFATSCLLTQATACPESARPNVLFIAIDDLRPALGCYGDLLAKSPNIDTFAKSARQFNRAYVQQAVCGPSRTSLLTGLLPDHTRVWHNRNRFRETLPHHVTLPQLFKQSGYYAVGYGKIFSGNEKELDPISWSEPEILRRKAWKNYLLPINQGNSKKQSATEAANVADDAYPDGKLALLASETLEKLSQTQQPFFLAIGFYKPHLPFNAPQKYWQIHNADEFRLTANDSQPVANAPALALHTHRELGGYKGIPKNEQLTSEQTAHLRHGYYACVSYVDAQVGKILSTLRKLQLDKNTIVVLWGDHGFSLGETNRWCKATNFELDTRVPLLIRVPGMARPGVATDSLVEVVDIYPTLAKLAGLQLHSDVDGRSFEATLNAPTLPARDSVLSQFNRPWESSTPKVMGYSIRTQSERYTRWIDWQSRETISEELYDYSSSPNARAVAGHWIEDRNVASSQIERLKRMRIRMDETLTTRLRMAGN